jgi:hypothetical protein
MSASRLQGHDGMAELIHRHSTRFRGDDGTIYAVYVLAEERADGTWAGWLEFHPTIGGKPMLRTGQETSQPSRVTMAYWASGLEPVYLDGAFARAGTPR